MVSGLLGMTTECFVDLPIKPSCQRKSELCHVSVFVYPVTMSGLITRMISATEDNLLSHQKGIVISVIPSSLQSSAFFLSRAGTVGE